MFHAPKKMFWEQQIYVCILAVLSFWTVVSSLKHPDIIINETECIKYSKDIKLPCLCSTDDENGTLINCNGITFPREFPVLPHRSKIHSFSQSESGLQSLEAQLFTASNIPLKKLDFSNNLLRRITERTFDGVESTLKEINLSKNKLGDQLNSVFATGEFRRLAQLELLDLSGNELKGFQPGVFNGLMRLKELHFGQNELTAIPKSSLESLHSLEKLHLQMNHISKIDEYSFPNLPSLHFLNITSNDIITIQDNALTNLPNLKTLILSNNQISVLTGSSFFGLEQLEHLDLSQNLLEYIPNGSLSKSRLKKLILYSNKIRSLNQIPLDDMTNLEYLDLRRNRIFEIPPNSFSNLRNLKEIRIDVNTVRKITNEMFVGLEDLSDLTLNDNRILAFPTEPLNIFKNLRKLSLDYNRIAAISREILYPVKNNEELSLAFNLISEIPDRTFLEFKNLALLNLHGNKIRDFSREKVRGIEDTLLYLDVGYNEITHLPKLHFSKLLILSVARNRISGMVPETLKSLTEMKYFNMSYNLLSDISPHLFTNLKKLESLDLQQNLLSYIPGGVFRNLSVVHISLKENRLKEIAEFTFDNLARLKHLDLSHNSIVNIAENAFNAVPNVEVLNLMGNKLAMFKGDIFSSQTKIHTLNLRYNKISYLYTDSFIIHPNIQHLDLSFNELTFFPRESINSLYFLSHINLAGNKLHSLSDGHFSNMPNLKMVELNDNAIDTIGDFAFQNSSNVHYISLRNNRIIKLSESTLIGLNRLELDLSNNNLSSLPSDIFSRVKDLKLESLNLAMNNLRDFPNDALKRQYSYLERVNISFNRVTSLPSNADVLVNIKELDLSQNPLSTDAHHVLFGEPKSLRVLHAQNVGISSLPIIESPFLRQLNLNGNKLTNLNTVVFQRTNMLIDLDVSQNAISSLASSWDKVHYLQKLDLSGNPIRHIGKTDFTHLQNLRELKINNLQYLTEINCDSFRSLPKLRKLEMHGFHSLPTLNIKQCLHNITRLEHLGIEIKDMYLKDQLQAVFSPKLNALDVTGKNLRSISSSAFAGMLSSTIKVSLFDTSVDTFSDKIFLPLPLSSKIEFKIPNNRIRRLAPEMLSVLDNKQVDIVLDGLDMNPLTCDCNMSFLWNWIQDKINGTTTRHPGIVAITNLECSQPSSLKGKKMKNLKADELICNEHSTEVTDSTVLPSFTPSLKETTSNREHPYIIFEPPVTKRPVVPQSYVPTSGSRSTLTKVDTMIIGIVAGVVAFVCILIIIICIVRLRRAHPLYTAGPLAGPLAFRAQGKCTCLKPPPNNCTCYPMYSVPYPCIGHNSFPGSSMSHKMLPAPLPPPSNALHPIGKVNRLRNTPYYVTYPDSENDNK